MLIMKLLMQETSHRDAIHLLITADRRSLTAELNDVRAEIESLRRELQAAKDQHAEDLRQAEQQAVVEQLHASKRGKLVVVLLPLVLRHCWWSVITYHTHTHTHTHMIYNNNLMVCKQSHQLTMTLVKMLELCECLMNLLA